MDMRLPASMNIPMINEPPNLVLIRFGVEAHRNFAFVQDGLVKLVSSTLCVFNAAVLHQTPPFASSVGFAHLHFCAFRGHSCRAEVLKQIVVSGVPVQVVDEEGIRWRGLCTLRAPSSTSILAVACVSLRSR